jgi:hypothetical protein
LGANESWGLAFWLVASLRFTFSRACSSALPQKGMKQHNRTVAESALVLLTDPKGFTSWKKCNRQRFC